MLHQGNALSITENMKLLDNNCIPKNFTTTTIIFHTLFVYGVVKRNLLQPFSHNYHLTSLITYVVCVNATHKCQELHFKVDSERWITFFFLFWETFSWQLYFFSEFLSEICWEVAEEIFFMVSFCSSLISQHITYSTTTTTIKRNPLFLK